MLGDGEDGDPCGLFKEHSDEVAMKTGKSRVIYEERVFANCLCCNVRHSFISSNRKGIFYGKIANKNGERKNLAYVKFDGKSWLEHVPMKHLREIQE